jgi:hypothetical protein
MLIVGSVTVSGHSTSWGALPVLLLEFSIVLVLQLLLALFSKTVMSDMRSPESFDKKVRNVGSRPGYFSMHSMHFILVYVSQSDLLKYADPCTHGRNVSAGANRPHL